MPYRILFSCLLTVCILSACADNNTRPAAETEVKDTLVNSYGSDRTFLKKYTSQLTELTDSAGHSKILVSGDYQARVMTSTANGDSSYSFGWINYNLLSSPQKKAQFNPVGGEERFWLGPEGGQFSLYFKAKDSFTIRNWQVPAVIDTVAYKLEKQDASSVRYSSQASLVNYSGTRFDIDINREIRLLTGPAIEQKLGMTLPAGIKVVGYETINSIRNSGKTQWTKENGLLSVWLLGMFTPSPETMVVIPFRPVPGAKELITSDYFGIMPADRLVIEDSVLYFTCDGKYRSKIGLSPLIAKPMAASLDKLNKTITIVIPVIEREGLYVNSKWEMQREPYKGDAINAYNDGPLEDGTQLGPFYEIESSSPAKALNPGEALTYRQVTIHLQAEAGTFAALVRQVLNVELK